VNDAHWRVVVDDRARKDLRRLDLPTRQRILSAITRLAHGAELVGDIKRVTGSGEYRLRVGDWRVRFERDDRLRTIVVVRVLPRGRAYRERSTPLPRRDRLHCQTVNDPLPSR